MNENSPPDTADAAVRLHDILGILTVICIAVLPDAHSAVASWMGWVEAPTKFGYLATSLIVRSIQVSAPVLLIVWLSQSDWHSLGIRRVRWFKDILLGLGIWLLGTFAFYGAYSVLPSSVFPPFDAAAAFEKPTGGFGYLLLLVASCANGFAEELVIRGYLLTRIERVLNSTWAALLITSLLFASYHLYQGVGSTICIAALGLVYGAAFCLCRRLWPLVVAHAVADFVGWLFSA